MLLQAVERFPSEADLLLELAWLHEAERSWPEAERYWSEFVTLDPSPWWAQHDLANALMEQGRLAEAEAVLSQQFARLAHEPGVFVAYARLAERQRNWEEAEKRWSDVAARFPSIWEGFGGQVRSLRQQQRLDEAGALLAGNSDRFPGLDGPIRERAELAEALGDWTAAQDAWRTLISIDKRFWLYYAHLARSECKLGRIDAAFATCAEAQSRFPSSLNIVVDFIRALVEEGYVEDAQDLVAEALTAPFSPSAEELIQLAWLALRCQDLDRAVDIAHRLRAALLEDSQLAEKFSQFETALKVRIAEFAPEKLARLAEIQHASAGFHLRANDPAAASELRIAAYPSEASPGESHEDSVVGVREAPPNESSEAPAVGSSPPASPDEPYEIRQNEPYQALAVGSPEESPDGPYEVPRVGSPPEDEPAPVERYEALSTEPDEALSVEASPMFNTGAAAVVPMHQLSGKAANPWFRRAARLLNSMSGGNSVNRNDPSP